MRTNIQVRWMFCFALLPLTTGCTFSTTLDDRLAYSTEKSLMDRHKGAKALNFAMDQETRQFEYTGHPSGVLGIASQRSFPIGSTFAAYLEQSQKAIFSPANHGAEIPIGVHLADCQLKYTNSATAFTGMRRAVDWVDITLTVETQFPWDKEKPTRITIHREDEATVNEMAEATNTYLSVTRALSGIVSDYVDEVIRRVSAHESVTR